MYVCLCKAVTDRQIRSAVASGASTLSALRARLGVASDCRGCTRSAARVLDEARSSPGAESPCAAR